MTPEVRDALAARLHTDDVPAALHTDFRYVFAKPVAHAFWEHPQMRAGGSMTHGFYQDTHSHPLAHVRTLEDVRAYAPLRTPEWFDFGSVGEQAQRLRDAGFVTVFGNAGIVDIVNGLGSRGIGYERMICNLLTGDEVTLALVERCLDADFEYCRQGLEAGNGMIDILYIGEDCGTQNGPLFPPSFFREFFAPRMKRFADLAHRWGARCKLHSCGSTRDLMPVFIDDIGVDILDAVQPEPAGMGPEGLKRDFGDRLTFCGMLSLQRTLASGTPQECRDEAEHRIRVIGRQGGYIVGPPNTFTIDIPLENILAVYAAATGDESLHLPR